MPESCLPHIFTIFGKPVTNQVAERRPFRCTESLQLVRQFGTLLQKGWIMADEHDGAPPQEDINDKLLLDLAWEKQQKKVRRRRGVLQKLLAMHIFGVEAGRNGWATGLSRSTRLLSALPAWIRSSITFARAALGRYRVSFHAWLTAKKISFVWCNSVLILFLLNNSDFCCLVQFSPEESRNSDQGHWSGLPWWLGPVEAAGNHLRR